MKYEIRIEGGFTGIPKEFKGEIELREEEKKGLWHAFEQDTVSKNPSMRDGQTYHLKVIEGEETHQASFEETQLPLPIRQFIDTIAKKN